MGTVLFHHSLQFGLCPRAVRGMEQSWDRRKQQGAGAGGREVRSYTWVTWWTLFFLPTHCKLDCTWEQRVSWEEEGGKEENFTCVTRRTLFFVSTCWILDRAWQIFSTNFRRTGPGAGSRGSLREGRNYTREQRREQGAGSRSWRKRTWEE